MTASSISIRPVVGWATLLNAERISSGDIVGRRSSINATVPLTTGAAKLVPTNGAAGEPGDVTMPEAKPSPEGDSPTLTVPGAESRTG